MPSDPIRLSISYLAAVPPQDLQSLISLAELLESDRVVSQGLQVELGLCQHRIWLILTSFVSVCSVILRAATLTELDAFTIELVGLPNVTLSIIDHPYVVVGLGVLWRLKIPYLLLSRILGQPVFLNRLLEVVQSLIEIGAPRGMPLQIQHCYVEISLYVLTLDPQHLMIQGTQLIKHCLIYPSLRHNIITTSFLII